MSESMAIFARFFCELWLSYGQFHEKSFKRLTLDDADPMRYRKKKMLPVILFSIAALSIQVFCKSSHKNLLNSYDHDYRKL
jgi:hypothetical protein